MDNDSGFEIVSPDWDSRDFSAGLPPDCLIDPRDDSEFLIDISDES